MADYRITYARDVAGIDDQGRPAQTKAVTYYVGTHGPFTVFVPNSLDWDTKAQEAIRANVDSLRRLGLI